MIETADPATFQLAVLIGAAALAAGIGALRRPDMFTLMFDDLERSPGLVMTIAMVAITLGGLILLMPGGWSDPLAILVSAIGVASVLEGLALLAIPDLYLPLYRPLLRYARAWAVFACLLGIALLALGLPGLLP